MSRSWTFTIYHSTDWIIPTEKGAVAINSNWLSVYVPEVLWYKFSYN